MANAVNWFEIPVENLERACKFYEAILDTEIHTHEIMQQKMGFLHHTEDGVGGALVQGNGYVPSNNGALVYLNGGDDLSKPLSKVGAAGGQVVQEKMRISEEIGYMGIFLDSEGNRVAFHSLG